MGETLQHHDLVIFPLITSYFNKTRG